jgi:hypothetical protein
VYQYAFKFELEINKKFLEDLIAHFPWYDKSHIENDASNNSSIDAYVFVTAVTYLPSRCLAMIRGLLPNSCLATITGFLPTRCLATIREFLRSPCLATIRGIHRHTHTQKRDLISLLLFFQNKEIWGVNIFFLSWVQFMYICKKDTW